MRNRDFMREMDWETWEGERVRWKNREIDNEKEREREKMKREREKKSKKESERERVRGD